MVFVKENVNPKGIKSGDCVVRALVKITDKDWYEVYDELCTIVRREATMPSDRITFEKIYRYSQSSKD